MVFYKRIYLLILFFIFSIGANAQIENKRTHKRFSSFKKAISESYSLDTLLIYSGVYKEETIIVDKPLTLLGKNDPILSGEKKREIMVVKADSVFISGIYFKDVGESFTKDFAAIRVQKSKHFSICDNQFENVFYGVFLEKSSEGLIKGNYIRGNAELEYKSGNGIHIWHCQQITIEDNDISGVRDGIYFEFVDDSFIKGNISHHNLRYGLHFMFSNRDTYRENKFDSNGAGVAVMFSKFIKMYTNTFSNNWGTASYGLLLKEIYDASIEGNIFKRNTIGINAEGSNRIDYKNNQFIENGWAVRIKGACFENIFTHNNFLNNTFDISYSGNLNDNKFDGNYWSDYTGYDLNKDGYGDVPYRPVKLFSYIVNKSPESILLLRSLFIDIINFSEKVAPIFTPDNLLDKKPLMKKISL